MGWLSLHTTPTWRLRRKNVLISPDGIRVVEYEEVVLVFGGSWPRLEFDRLERRMGSEELEELVEVVGRARTYR